MTDQVKEIYNGSITVANLVAGNGSGTIVTTDANTQYVVKDVALVSNAFTGITPTLTINNTQVASVPSSLTGSEIVDINSTLKAKLYSTAPTTQKQTTTYISTSPTAVYATQVNYLLNGTSVAEGASTSTSVTNPSNFNSNLYQTAFDNSGNFYYVSWDGNSQTTFYKRTGGINGSDSNLFSGSNSYAPKCFNGVDSYYWIGYNDYTFYKYNINTGTSTTFATPVFSSTSYPDISMINNGYVCFHKGDSQPTSVWIFNPVTGASSQITGLPSVAPSTNHNVKVYYNATTNRYTIWRRNNNSTIYWTTLTNPLTLGSDYSSGYTSGQFAQNGTLNSSATNLEVTSNTISWPSAGSGYTDKVTYTVASSTTATYAESRLVNVGSTLPGTVSSSLVAETNYALYPNTLQLRLTGVKSTI